MGADGTPGRPALVHLVQAPGPAWRPALGGLAWILANATGCGCGLNLFRQMHTQLQVLTLLAGKRHACETMPVPCRPPPP